MKKIGALVIIFSVLLTITIAPIFAANYDLSSTYTKSQNIPLDGVSSDYTNPVIFNANISCNKLYVIDYDIEYTETGFPTYTFTPSTSSVSSTTTSSLGGSISMNSPTSTGSQSGRFTLANLTTTTGTYGFTASPTGTQTLTSHEAYIYQLDTIFYMSFSNPNGITLRPAGNLYYLTPSFSAIDSHYLGASAEILDTNGLTFNGFTDTDRLIFSFDNLHSYTSQTNNTVYGLIDQYETISCSVKLSIFFFSTTQLSNVSVTSLDNFGFNSFTQPSYDFHPNQTMQSYNLNNSVFDIQSNVQSILDSYNNNTNNATNTQSNINDVNSSESQLHQAEQNFYQQNEQALNNVGLSNFSFSGDQSSGLGSVITDFTTLWNNIGPLQIIFTFTLSMSLATFLLRHRPITGAIKKNEKR